MKQLWIATGNVGIDPEVKEVKEGVKKAVFTFATSKTYKNSQQQKVTDTQWHRIIAWRGLAEIIEKYIKKGALLQIYGEIQYSKWTDKEGVERYSADIVADEILILPTGKKEEEK